MEKDLKTSLTGSESALEAAPVLEKQAKEPEADTVKSVDRDITVDSDNEKGKASISQSKKQEAPSKEPSIPKSSTKKSSRFYSASYFSSGDEAEFSPSMVFSGLASAIKEQLVKVVVGMALVLAGYVPALVPYFLLNEINLFLNIDKFFHIFVYLETKQASYL